MNLPSSLSTSRSCGLAFAAVLALGASSPALAQDQNPVPSISVSAEGSASAVPDMAITRFTVLREADDTVEAMDAANKAMADVIAAMKEFGIAARDLQTAGFNVRPIYDNRPRKPVDNGEDEGPRITGYTVSNTLTVRIRDLAKTGEILSKAIELGVNADGNLSLTSADPDQYLEEARRDAVEQAMDKARTLAEAAKVSLGDILSIEEGGYSRPPMPMGRMEMKMADTSAPVPVEAGENEYTVTVSMKIAIDRSEQ
ncbi:SIMPL domain-containing protein [Notoacmeibacter ruber]|uniref:SIMPL domain-containing protein n=1 Tax=Notoacmeibacter ruber TaxID=2670375 RepID=A0A3L7JC99_9HYPH|nr:SIMPL domain-containing protein [Notoacmeibacter ruber]RLQ88283.1 SIMPL domain-containing protein [Notoacmeibacter ruber]